MKVLVARGSPGIYGGAEISAHDHALMLRAAGHEPFFVTNFPRLRHQLRDQGIPVFHSYWAQKGAGPLRYLNFFIVFPLMWLHYLTLVWGLRPDVINPHSREDQIIFTLLKPLHRRPVIWKDPGDLRFLIKSERRNPMATIYQWLLIRAVKRADFIYVLNAEDRDRLAQFAGWDKPEEHIAVVPSSMLFDNYRLDANPMPHTKPVVGTINRLEPGKGVEHLIAAAHQLLSEGRELEFWIVGEGSQRAELERLAADHEAIHFWGEQSDVSPFYRAFAIFVQAADNEAWGRTVKEAMFFTLPVVGSNSGGVGAQVKHEVSGLLFAPGQPADLAKQLRRLLDYPKLYEKLAKGARRQALKEGDFSRIFTEQILPIFERVAR